ncbi:endonuclease G, mitochondrial-like isoform X3 [Homalodisca vitripennis]|uniref:endonuclease G, mitochondrial-like isoform X3 n=1 Tax=Homalodisca vitripennis TaxID=197043 RepID=UPI001EEBBA04|nr:endonuclease G, mitochondrial-like isoform X3 [Homalodisca vitripennis]
MTILDQKILTIKVAVLTEVTSLLLAITGCARKMLIKRFCCQTWHLKLVLVLTETLGTGWKSMVEADGKSYVKYQVIGVNHVAVPTHFFKIVVMETSDNKLHMEAYVMPNQKIDDKTPLNVFLVPPESIERASGLLFFDRMSRSNLVQINGRKTTYV